MASTAALQTVVFSASIDNEAAIRRWMEEVQEQAGEARQALDRLHNLLERRPHVSINLHARESSAGGAET